MSIEAAIKALQSLYGDQVTTNTAILDAHGQNEAYFPVTPPDAVVFPNTTLEVSEIVKVCAANDCPIIAYGTGTSLEGHQLAVRGGISLDMSKMNAVLDTHTEDMDVVVQPGVTREQLNEDLRATGLFFPVDPGANASLGGMTATRASGTTAVRYGTMRENVLALEVVMADGRIIRTGTRARKSSAGYDLTKLFVGSEGTLGIITEITLRLQGQPEAVSAATCSFPDIESAVNTVIATIQMGIPMARIEFVDGMMARGFNLFQNVNLAEVPQLFVEFHGTPNGVKEQAETFGEIVSDMGGSDFAWSANAEDRAALWKMRHNAYYGQKALSPKKRVQNTDVCVPISRLAEAVMFAHAERDRLGLMVTILGHTGDGNFHCGIIVDLDDAEEMGNAREFTHNLNKLALKLDGTVTGEHGVGMGKMKYMAEEHGGALQIMVDIKKALDPQNIMNPGKMLPSN
ncbi:2-hydroxy-acid oxidase [Rhodobacterales bacterium 52_120_T64]|nr:2-hydroxy-acid oxidase [Rhodobacterales bacterium 52_120_T64]